MYVTGVSGPDFGSIEERQMATEKFKALVHFIVHECREPGRLGAIRLNKALWHTDVLAYQMNGVPVTGETYVKMKFGPVPAHVDQALSALVEEGKLVIRPPEHQYDTKKFISLVPADTNLLSDDDRELARAMLDYVCGRPANEVSEETHDVVWEAAAVGEVIPLQATLAATEGTLSDGARAWAAAIANEVEGLAA
jgi:hypothetical protein